MAGDEKMTEWILTVEWSFFMVIIYIFGRRYKMFSFSSPNRTNLARMKMDHRPDIIKA